MYAEIQFDPYINNTNLQIVLSLWRNGHDPTTEYEKGEVNLQNEFEDLSMKYSLRAIEGPVYYDPDNNIMVYYDGDVLRVWENVFENEKIFEEKREKISKKLEEISLKKAPQYEYNAEEGDDLNAIYEYYCDQFYMKQVADNLFYDPQNLILLFCNEHTIQVWDNITVS